MKSYQIWYTYSRPWGELKFWSWVTSDQRSRSQTTLKTHILTAYSCLYIRRRTLKLVSFVSILELFFKNCLMNDLEVMQGQKSRSFVKILSFCEFSWYMSCFLCSTDQKNPFFLFSWPWPNYFKVRSRDIAFFWEFKCSLCTNS